MNTITDSPLLGLSQRLPPSNLQAEQALLGALLASAALGQHFRAIGFVAPKPAFEIAGKPISGEKVDP